MIHRRQFQCKVSFKKLGLVHILTGADLQCRCRFVQSNAYKAFLERGHKLKYNEFGTARPALESLPIIAAGILGIGQGQALMSLVSGLL